MPNLRSIIAIALALMAVISVQADVTTLPGSKVKLTPKDLRKDLAKNGYQTPEARAATANFVSGNSVEIVLEADTAYLGMVRFVIRDQPRFGRLSEIKAHPTALNKAVVTYTHDAFTEQLADSFTYTARLFEGNSSSPATVALAGRRAEPIIEIVRQPGFAKVEPSIISRGILTLRNKGYAAYSQDITWPAPWQGPPRIELKVGEQRDFIIAARPVSAGAYSFERDLQPGQAASHFKCYVECLQAFVVSPGTVEMRFDPTTGTRSASVQVSNSSEAPLKLTVQAPGRIIAPTQLSLETKQAQTLTFSIADTDVQAFRGELWLVQEPHREKIIVTAPAEPSQVKLVSPASNSVELGIVKRGDKATLRVALENVGGSPAQLAFIIPPPFVLEKADDPSLVLPPQTQREWTISFAPQLAGGYETLLTFDSDGGKHQLRVKGTLVDPNKPAASAMVAANAKNGSGSSSPGQRTTNAANSSTPFRPAIASDKPAAAAQPPKAMPATQLTSAIVVGSAAAKLPPADAVPAASSAPAASGSSATTSSTGLPAVAPAAQRGRLQTSVDAFLATRGIGPSDSLTARSAKLKRVESIGAKEATADSVTLIWTPAPDPAPAKYSIETSTFVPRPGAPSMKVWLPVPNWESVNVHDDLLAAKIPGLLPRSRYEFRVIGEDEDGRFAPASDVLSIITPAPQRIPAWAWWLLVSLIGIVAVVVLHRVQQGHWQRA